MISLSLGQTWDLELTPSGSLATTKGKARIAQDAATACRTFRGECWFNISRGIPYPEQIFGGSPPPTSSSVNSSKPKPYPKKGSRPRRPC